MVAAPLTIPIRTITLSPGSHLLIDNISWEQYEALLKELGEHRRVPRINYYGNILELMAPLPLHARPHRLIGYIVTALLDTQERAWEDFGSTTFKKTGQAGLEPDTCFYIQNAERMRDRQRLDMEIDPPPDLAIESDVTSKTTLDAYWAIAVPEVWIYGNGKLSIYVLQADGYMESANSPTFPDLPLVEMIPRLIQQAFEQGTSQMLRELRRQT